MNNTKQKSSGKQTGIELKLIGEDGNAFSILGRARVALRRGKMGDRIARFTEEATSGDYSNLLRVCSEWFIVK